MKLQLDRWHQRDDLTHPVAFLAIVLPGVASYFMPDRWAAATVLIVLAAHFALILIALSRRRGVLSERRIWVFFAGLIGWSAVTNVVFIAARLHGNHRVLGVLAAGLGCVALLCGAVGGTLAFRPFFRVPATSAPLLLFIVGFTLAGISYQWIQPSTESVPDARWLTVVAVVGVCLAAVGGAPAAIRLGRLERTAELWILGSASVFALGMLGVVLRPGQPPMIGVVSGPPTISSAFIVCAAYSQRSMHVGRSVRGLSQRRSKAAVLAIGTALAISVMLLVAERAAKPDLTPVVFVGLGLVESAILGWVFWTQIGSSGSVPNRAARAIANELRTGLVQGQIQPHYQPILRASDLRRAGYECVAMWDHPRLGLLAAPEFINAGTDVGDCDDIARIMLDTTFRHLGDLLVSLESDESFVSIKVSPSRLEQQGFADELFARLVSNGRDGTGLVLEMTEASAVTSWDQLLMNIESLQAMGVAVAVDNFGSGNANYSALLRFEPDIVKLDRSIVEAAGSDRGRRLLRSAILAADSVGALIIAQGVGDEASSVEMQRLGVHFVQGDRLALPLRIAEIVRIS